MPKDDKSKLDKNDDAKQGAAKKRVGKARGPGDVDGSRTPRIRPIPEQRLSRSLEYGVAILELFSRKRQRLGIAEMSEIVGMSRSTTHRYAMTLVALGFLEQDSKRKYRLADRAAGPGNVAVATVQRRVGARAVLEELRDETGHTVSMGVLDGARIIYVYRLLGHRIGQYEIDRDLRVGARIPAYCSALGKVLLASLSDAERRELLSSIKLIRQGPNTILKRSQLEAELEHISPRGVVVSDEELLAGARSIAVLINRPPGEHPLAIEITVPASAYTVERLVKHLGPRIKRAAKLISGG
jgi:IclR family pca regulon transcriptional regulator